MKHYLAVLLFSLLMLSSIAFSASITHAVFIPKVKGVRQEVLAHIGPVVEKSLAEEKYPGAVILAAHRGKIIYRGVFGLRRILPTTAAMKFDTIFDVASLTKVVVTTPAVMQLVERGQLILDAPVARYWPEFAQNGKANITIRELLTHSSGLQGDLTDPQRAPVLQQIAQLPVIEEPGTTFLYSDLNFIVLGYLVERISGEPLQVYARQHIFRPLQMQHTFYNPAADLRDKIAPTEMQADELRWGVVHDPSAQALGGIAGNAGLFSDAKDLGLYAQCLLDGGRIRHPGQKTVTHLLGPLTVLKMITPQSPPGMETIRGLGWDIDSAYANRGILLPVGSFGHSGWTGTSMWIDPLTQTWVIILTSRTHPKPAKVNQLLEDRQTIATIIAASITDVKFHRQSNTSVGEMNKAYPQ